jgi:hypothetical protein
MDSQERLSELIWRTVKLRLALLIAAAVMLLVTWSGLTDGNADAKKLDIDFCNHVEEETSASLKKLTPNWSEKPLSVCTPATARLFIESGRAFSLILPLEGEAFDKKKAELAEYDEKRKAAYKLEIGLSSQGGESKVIVNALSVAQVEPFVVVVILSIVMVLGFQQKAYRTRLRTLLAALKSHEEQNQKIAETQFLSGFDVDDRFEGARWKALSPEGVAMVGLLAAVTYLLFAVLAAFVINLIHLTNSIFANYLFALYALVFFVIVGLWRTHLRYHISRESPRKFKFSFVGVLLKSDWLARIFVFVAVLSIFLPWTTNGMRGYRFVAHQKPLFMAHGHAQYPLDPGLFMEVRLQLLVVAMFLGVFLLKPSLRKAPKHVRIAFDRADWIFTLLTLFLVLNYLLYMGSLEYLSLTDADFSTAWFLGVMNRDAGYALSTYDPAFGFIIFVFCCLMLCCISLFVRRSRVETI